MMRNGNRAFVNQMLIYAVVMICGGGGVGLGTVWVRQKISVAENTAKALQAKNAELERRLAVIAADIATAQGPEMLKRRNVEWKLSLARPEETQIERVAANPVMLLAAKRRTSLYAELADRPAVIRLSSTR